MKQEKQFIISKNKEWLNKMFYLNLALVIWGEFIFSIRPTRYSLISLSERPAQPKRALADIKFDIIEYGQTMESVYFYGMIICWVLITVYLNYIIKSNSKAKLTDLLWEMLRIPTCFAVLCFILSFTESVLLTFSFAICLSCLKRNRSN